MAQANPSAPKPAAVQRTISLSKGKHKFVFRYGAGDERAVLGALTDLAKRRDVSFDLFDAAVLSHQLGQHLSQEIQTLVPKK